MDTCRCIHIDSGCDCYFYVILLSEGDGVDVGSEIFGGCYCTAAEEQLFEGLSRDGYHEEQGGYSTQIDVEK